MSELLIAYGNARERAAYWKNQSCVSQELLALYYKLWQESEEMASKYFAMLEKQLDTAA